MKISHTPIAPEKLLKKAYLVTFGKYLETRGDTRIFETFDLVMTDKDGNDYLSIFPNQTPARNWGQTNFTSDVTFQIRHIKKEDLPRIKKTYHGAAIHNGNTWTLRPFLQ